MEVTKAVREFKYNGVALKDPDPSYSLEQVREFYSAIYPEIVNADIEGPTMTGSKTCYEFRRAVGTKGSERAALRARIEASAEGREMPAGSFRFDLDRHAKAMRGIAKAADVSLKRRGEVDPLSAAGAAFLSPLP
jgi:PRTRC genetic system protein C